MEGILASLPPFVTVVNAALFGLLLVIALIVMRFRGLYADAMLLGMFSLMSASIFAQLDALDVSLTEAAVGAGVSTVLFITALALTRSTEHVTPRRRVVPGLLVTLLAGGGLVYASTDLPPIGSGQGAVHQHPITDGFLQTTEQDIGIPNVVTAVLASFRGYDTLGEVVVIFTAGVGVLMLMFEKRTAETQPPSPADPAGTTDTDQPAATKPSEPSTRAGASDAATDPPRATNTTKAKATKKGRRT